ncbi:universal stress protein [Maridesulfovibrio sp.]|uniref:universal stress protein n=1 Tax=Maridesulfovibrio sp. TaxID=2795000 RepID=UPI0029F46D4B|nr:universal stress protein [Maridesulfovibrio sp.]
MTKKILLHFDSRIDAALIKNSLDFANKCGATLDVLNVFAEPKKSALDYFNNHGKDLKKHIIDGHTAKLEEELEEARINAENIKFSIRWGKDFIECIKSVNEKKYDMVICPPAEPNQPPNSTIMHLLRKCPCPVWVHHGHLWRGAVRILAAIGPFDSSSENIALNRNILEHASMLNQVLGGKLHIMHCWKGYLEGITTNPYFSELEVENYLSFEKDSSEAAFNDIIESVSFDKEPRRIIMHGDPGTIIPEYALEQKMDIVVMGSIARSGIAGLLIGNTAEKIAGSLTESLLAIKPAGFVSPVK